MWRGNDSRAELYHYGILGMKWGVRRYQNPDGTLTAAGRERYTESKKSASSTEAESAKKRGLSDKQKKALKIGAAIAVTALAAYGGYRLAKSGKLNALVDAGKRRVTGILGDVSEKGNSARSSGLKMLDHKESVEEAVSKANPTRNHYNCYNCVTATTLRMCGIDAAAKGDTRMGKGRAFEDICKAFKVKEDDILHVTSPDIGRVQRNILRKFKEGDIGAIGLTWNNPALGDGHTMNWTIRNGKVEFMDGQIGMATDILMRYLASGMDKNHEVEIARFANTITGLNLDSDVDIDLLREFI